MEKNNDDDDDGNNWRMCVCAYVICESDHSDQIGKNNQPPQTKSKMTILHSMIILMINI